MGFYPHLLVFESLFATSVMLFIYLKVKLLSMLSRSFHGKNNTSFSINYYTTLCFCFKIMTILYSKLWE